MTARKLLIRLAQFDSFSWQGEFLCTQGLSYLLEDQAARSAFAGCILTNTGFPLDDDVSWRAEVWQTNRRRPDLEAIDHERRLVAKIEAKLSAVFSKEQLESYLAGLRENCRGNGLLLLLVPDYRAKEAVAVAQNTFSPTGDGPWKLGEESSYTIATITWETVLNALRAGGLETSNCDLDQFRAMYRVLIADDIDISGEGEGLEWHVKEEFYLNLAERVIRSLIPEGERLPPVQREKYPLPMGYRLRYHCRMLGDKKPCFSVGVRDPSGTHNTPIWLRFHHDTPGFSTIRANIDRSSLRERWVVEAKHIWFPLDVHDHGDRSLVDYVVEQAKAILKVAYGDYSSGEPVQEED